MSHADGTLAIRPTLDIMQVIEGEGLYSAPLSTRGAAITYVVVSPTPGEVWEFLPSSLYWEATDLQLYETLPNPQAGAGFRFTRQALEQMETAFPPVRGRAGGKVNVNWADIWVPGVVSKRGKEMLSLLHHNRDLLNMESLPAISLILLDSYSSAAHIIVDFIIANASVLLEDLKTITKWLKTIHVGIRTTRTFPGLNRMLTPAEQRCLYGLDSIVGRSEDLRLDTKAEVLMRLEDPSVRAIPSLKPGPLFPELPDGKTGVSTPAFMKEINLCVDQAVLSALSKEVEVETFSDWYDRRMYWAASGGAPGFKVTWDEGAADQTQRLNKRGALISLPLSHLENILKHPQLAVNYSKASTKFENGKTRAIWNSSIELYVFQAYILDQFDRACQKDTWHTAENSLESKLVGDLSRLYSLISNNGIMWDYSDFNINHTFDIMVSLYTSTVNSIKKRAVVPRYVRDHVGYKAIVRRDLDRCLDWVANARHNTILSHETKDDDLIIAWVARSLQSGERGTSFTNVMLSRTYLLYADKWAERHLPIARLDRVSFEQGDDVFGTSPSPIHAMFFCLVMNLLGFAGQVTKIMNDYRYSGEFLRRDYNARDLNVAGYPIRSAMGFLAGEFFLDSEINPGARASAFISQFAKIRERGGQLPIQLLHQFIKYKCALIYTSDDQRKHFVTVPLNRLNVAPALGGYSFTSSPFSESGASRQMTDMLQYKGGITPGTDLNFLGFGGSVVGLGSPMELPAATNWPLLSAVVTDLEQLNSLVTRYPRIFAAGSTVLNESELFRLRQLEFEGRKPKPSAKDYHSSCFSDLAVYRVWLTAASSLAPIGSVSLGQFEGKSEGRTSAALFMSLAARLTSLAKVAPPWTSTVFSVVDKKSLTLSKPPPLVRPAMKVQAFFPDRSTPGVRHAYNLPDLRQIRKYSPKAGKNLLAVKRAIVYSGVSGAFPPGSASEAAAVNAKNLESWLKTSKIEENQLSSTQMDMSRSAFSKGFDIGCSVWTDLLREPWLSTQPVAFSPFSAKTSRKAKRYLFSGTADRYGVGNSYGSFAGLVVPLGFSMAETLALAVTSSAPHKDYPGRAGRWVSLVSNIGLDRSGVTAHPAYTRFLTLCVRLSRIRDVAKRNASYNILVDYFEGGIGLLPPGPVGQSVEIISLCRAIALQTYENDEMAFFTPLIDTLVYISSVERALACSYFCINAANGYPVSLGD